MPRPCKIDTVQFRRPLDADARAILLAAGAGDLSRGFQDMLAIYAALHNAGFRPGDNVADWIIVTNANHSHLD
jgi:hypothetical protein